MDESLRADYWTVPEFAEQMNRSKRTIERWCRIGEAPPITKIGREPLIKKSSAKAWLASLEGAAGE